MPGGLQYRKTRIGDSFFHLLITGVEFGLPGRHDYEPATMC